MTGMMEIMGSTPEMTGRSPNETVSKEKRTEVTEVSEVTEVPEVTEVSEVTEVPEVTERKREEARTEETRRREGFSTGSVTTWTGRSCGFERCSPALRSCY